MKDVKNWTKWMYWFTLGIAIIFVYQLATGFDNISASFGRFFWVVRPFLMAVLIAYLFYIPCRIIENLYKRVKWMKKFARPLAVITAYLLVALLIVIVINVVFPSVSRSVIELANSLPGYYRDSLYFIDNMPEDSIISREAMASVIYALEDIDITTFVNPDNIVNYISGILRCC